MTRLRRPTTRAARTEKVSIPLTRDELREIDDFCKENNLTRAAFVRRALKDYRIQRAIGCEEFADDDV